MKNQIQLIALGLFTSAISMAMVIPKVDLATCQVPKEDIKSFFYTSQAESAKIFASANEFGVVTLQQVNLAGQAGIADFYKVSIRLNDANGKALKTMNRSLEQLAINHSSHAIAVGYAPYQVERTTTEPFTLLIEETDSSGAAVGYMNLVPLQSASLRPMNQIKMDCQISKMPEAPIRISDSEVLKLNPRLQFEVLYNLYRLGDTGSSVSVAKGKNASAVGMSDDLLSEIKKSISLYLSKRSFPPIADHLKKRNPEVAISEGDRCGALTITSLVPIYDSETTRQIFRTKDAQLKQKPLGYLIPRAACENVARVLTVDSYDGKEREKDEQKWQVSDIVVTTKGTMNESFRGSSFSIH